MAYATGILILAALFAVFAARAFSDDSPDLQSAWAATAHRRTRLARNWHRLTAAASRHYLTALILVGGILFLLVLTFYAWRLLPITATLLDWMQNLETAGNAEAARNIAFAIAAFAGMLAVLATVPFRLVRSWIAERTARVAESNLTTDLINKAVEGLGAEKTVSRIGRPVAGTDADRPDVTEIQWEGTTIPAGAKPPGDWQTFNKTEANLEVRIGAIYTLERIARENPEEHVRVMEILCAYIRENAKAADAKDHDLGDWPDYPVAITSRGFDARLEQLQERKIAMRVWLNSLPGPRVDIQTALTVIGRRSPDQISLKEDRGKRGGRRYRLDLQRADLRRTNLSHLDFANANLFNARMERANLRSVRMDGAWLIGAKIEGARLDGARMTEANLTGARMEGATLKSARLEWAKLSAARMQQVDLREAHMSGAKLISARLEAAELTATRMQGADFSIARLERTNLNQARLQDVDLRTARLEGADVRGTDLRFAVWGHIRWAALAHAADLRGAVDLTQAQLDRMIGNADTLLPDGLAPDTNQPFSIPSRWTAPGPPFLEQMMAGLDVPSEFGPTTDDLRAEFLCPEGTEPARTGTPLALDAPYPEGHPLAERDD